jgi:hypothetical protein
MNDDDQTTTDESLSEHRESSAIAEPSGARGPDADTTPVPLTSVSKSGFTMTTSAGQKVTVDPGGVVDRVVKLSNGEYEVHQIGVNWPHHVFVNQDSKVVGAE